MSTLELGPLLRHVDESSATIWVKTDGTATVRVTATEQVSGVRHRGECRTFAAHGHHYALVDLHGLPPGTTLDYTVDVDGTAAWPPERSDLPPSVIRTLDPARRPRILFGSCRTSVAHDEHGHRTHGVDALQAYALRLAGTTSARPDDPEPGAPLAWPDLVLFLGDQVYADELTEEMERFIASRRDLDEPPGAELKDFEEYAKLYQLAWQDPANRWLLSTLPSAMIFDDHDVRDDWNSSGRWRADLRATSWWHERIVAALASYWVYQHAGNLSPAARADDEVWSEIAAHAGDAVEYDATALLDRFAARVDEHPETYRWSYARGIGDRVRLVVVDSRAARVLDEDRRAMLDPAETAWLDGQLRGDVDHLLVGTSVPFLLAPGLHHVEAFGEALAGGGWGRRLRPLGDRLRRSVDLEHWAAFQTSFQEVCGMVLEVARGDRGRPPRSITFLSGDVHHSYVAEARPGPDELRRGGPIHSRLVQTVCSPIRNPLSRNMRFATAVLSYGIAGPVGHLVARSAKVPSPPVDWRMLRGPWFDNNIATIEVVEEGLRMWWATGVVEDGDHARPRLSVVADLTVEA